MKANHGAGMVAQPLEKVKFHRPFHPKPPILFRLASPGGTCYLNRTFSNGSMFHSTRHPKEAMMSDLLISNARIIDGTGEAAFPGQG